MINRLNLLNLCQGLYSTGEQITNPLMIAHWIPWWLDWCWFWDNEEIYWRLWFSWRWLLQIAVFLTSCTFEHCILIVITIFFIGARSWPGPDLAQPLWPGSSKVQVQGHTECELNLGGRVQVQGKCPGPGPDRTLDSLIRHGTLPGHWNPDSDKRTLSTRVSLKTLNAYASHQRSLRRNGKGLRIRLPVMAITLWWGSS